MFAQIKLHNKKRLENRINFASFYIHAYLRVSFLVAFEANSRCNTTNAQSLNENRMDGINTGNVNFIHFKALHFHLISHSIINTFS